MDTVSVRVNIAWVCLTGIHDTIMIRILDTVQYAVIIRIRITGIGLPGIHDTVMITILNAVQYSVIIRVWIEGICGADGIKVGLKNPGVRIRADLSIGVTHLGSVLDAVSVRVHVPWGCLTRIHNAVLVYIFLTI